MESKGWLEVSEQQVTTMLKKIVAPTFSNIPKFLSAAKIPISTKRISFKNVRKQNYGDPLGKVETADVVHLKVTTSFCKNHIQTLYHWIICHFLFR